MQKQILEHQLELEALRNEKMLVEDASKIYEYQTAQLECGFGKDRIEKWDEENQSLKEERVQLQDTICKLDRSSEYKKRKGRNGKNMRSVTKRATEVTRKANGCCRIRFGV